MDSLLEKIGHFVVSRPWIVAAAIVVITALAGAGLVELKTQFSVEQLQGGTSREHQALQEVRHTFGIDQQTLPILVRADDVTQPAVLGWMWRAAQAFDQLDGVDAVSGIASTPIPRLSPSASPSTSPTPPSTTEMLSRLAGGTIKISPIIDGPRVDQQAAGRLRRALDGSPLVKSRLVSDDGHATLMVLSLDSDIDDNDRIGALVDQIDQWLAANPPPAGVRASPTGLPLINATLVKRMKHDQTILVPAALALALLLLLGAFRWLPAVYLPVMAVVFSALILTGMMGWCGVPIDMLNNIVPLLVVIIGITDAIHLIHRYSRFARRQRLKDASVSTFRTMAVACFLTSFTTAVGFLSLMVSQTEILGRFGVIAACGIVTAYLIIIALVPAFLPMSGKPPESARESMLSDGLKRGLDRLTDLHTHRPWLLIAGFVVIAIPAAVYGFVDLEVDNAVLDQFSPDDPIYKTVRHLESAGFGVRPIQVVFRSPKAHKLDDPRFLNALDDFERWLDDQPAVLDVTGPTDYLHETWYLSTGRPQLRGAPFPDQNTVDALTNLTGAAGRNPLRRHLSADHDLARVNVDLPDIGGRATLRLANTIREHAGQSFAGIDGVDVVVTGSALMGSKAINVLIDDLLSSLLLAFVIIFVFMTVLLRSLRLGLVSIPVTVLPLLTTAGYMAVRDIPLNAATVIIFSVSIGLAVDGAIHVLARFREEVAHGAPTDAALRTAVTETGEAVILMYTALTLGFALMLFSSFLPVRRFGELIGVTVLTCMLSTLVLLPPLLKLVWPDQHGAVRADSASNYTDLGRR